MSQIVNSASPVSRPDIRPVGPIFGRGRAPVAFHSALLRDLRGRTRSSRRLYARLSGPEIAEAEGDRIKRADIDWFVVLRVRNLEPLPFVQLEGLAGAVRRVDEPQVGDSFAGVDAGRLTFRSKSRVESTSVSHTQSGAITASRVSGIRGCSRLFAAPACDIRDQDVLSEVQIGLAHDPPSARSATTKTERVSQTRQETGFPKRLQTGRTRADIQRPVDDLGPIV